MKKLLAKYRAKRDFSKTAEPSGDADVKEAKGLRFVIQKHAASNSASGMKPNGSSEKSRSEKSRSNTKRKRRIICSVSGLMSA
jgi:hypothetical protein